MTVEIELVLDYKGETEASWGVREDIDSSMFWLPKARVDMLNTKNIDGVVYATFEMPEWLAKDRGLI